MAKIDALSRYLKWSCKAAGRPASVLIAIIVVLIWFVIGLFIGFSDTWILLINTVATINAALMVFIIQNTQNRESRALHLKIDELIFAIKEAENELIAIEDLGEEELDKISQILKQKKVKSREKSRETRL